ncbi:MAG TPA: DUF4388 domain-containing protein [Thermoanaerobaculaceae bacterium]|nr:DUF4388 domain-containing protein [Thermoanaerobaculaceae bacterium]
MSLAGHLSEVALPELLQVVSRAEKTGRLVLTTGDGDGLIVFRTGRIIYAASNAARESLGSILVRRRLIDEPTLRKALERQYRSHEERRLCSILVEIGAVPAATLETVVYQQIARVIGEFMGWREGYFKFEPMAIADHGEIEVDAREFLAPSGFDAHRVALDLTRGRAEAAADAPTPRAPASMAPDLAAQLEALPEPAAGPPAPPASLAAIMASHPTTTLTAEATSEILRLGAQRFARGVLLLVERHGASGMGQFGLAAESGDADEGIRNLWLPLDEDSVIGGVVASRHGHRGPLRHTPLNQALVKELGGGWPAEVAALPVVVAARVAAVLYADTPRGGAAAADTAALEARLAEIGRALGAARR